MFTITENKSANIFRRFIDGWFSVFLFIFVVTLCVRLFLFDSKAGTPAHASHPTDAHRSVSQVIENSVGYVVQSSQNGFATENPISFDSEHGLTQN